MDISVVYESHQECDITDYIDVGVINDEKIKLEKGDKIIELRRIAYWSEKHDKVFEFITNNYELSADKLQKYIKDAGK
jgi:hypothetical protein